MFAPASSLVIFQFLILFLGIFGEESPCPADSKQEWSYRGRNRPMYWGEKFPECYKQQQSPIDIDTRQVKMDANLAKLTLQNYGIPVTQAKVENNGHSIEVVPDSSVVRSIEIDGSTYTLRQFHFHWGKSFNQGSEHTIDDQQYALEVHLVHINEKNEIAVVGVIFEEDKPNDELEKLVKLLKKLKYKGDETELDTSLILENLLPENPISYYRYKGSLTTPGCHEGVTWSVSPKIVSVGKEQMAEFRKLFSTKQSEADPECTIADNVRPVQPLYGRTVSLSQ